MIPEFKKQKELDELEILTNKLQNELSDVNDKYYQLLNEKEIIESQRYVGKYYMQEKANIIVYAYILSANANDDGDVFFISVNINVEKQGKYPTCISINSSFDPRITQHWNRINCKPPVEITKEEFMDMYYRFQNTLHNNLNLNNISTF